MGDMADYFSDGWIDDAANDDIILDRIERGIWVTADGTELPIKDMGTGHIRNCARWIQLQDHIIEEIMHEYMPLFKQELERRGIK